MTVGEDLDRKRHIKELVFDVGLVVVVFAVGFGFGWIFRALCGHE
jgi:hypothetical protein